MKLTEKIQILKSPSERYELSVRERKHKPIQLPTETDIDSYRKKLESLAFLMQNANVFWSLEGGLVLPLHTGLFHRRHADVDIGISYSDIPLWEKYMTDRGYNFFYRNPAIKFLEDTPYDVWKSASADNIMNNPVHRLYLVKTDNVGNIDEDENDLREIDVHVHKILEKDSKSMSKQGFSVPTSWILPTEMPFTSQMKLKVGSVELVYFFKLGANRPRHVFDKAFIESSGLLTEDQIKKIKEVYRLNKH